MERNGSAQSWSTMEHNEFFYRPVPLVPDEAPASDWRSHAFDHSPNADHLDAVEITVEGPPSELESRGDYDSLQSERDISAMRSTHDERHPIISTPTGPYEDRFLNTSSYDLRHRNFNSGRHIHAPHLRTQSDTTQSQSRPHFNIQSHQLNGSAVEDVWSPVEPSPTSPIPSSPAHSGYGPHSPVPPWATGDFLDLPPAMYGPHPQAFRGSDTSSVGSSSPNLEWSGSTSSFGPELYEPQDNSLHPPMQLPAPWDRNYLTPTGPMIYRHGNAPSLLSSDTSSIASPGPSTDWDAMSSYSDLPAQDTEADGQDENSPKTNSSDETERAASRMGDDFDQKLQLQDDNTYYATPFSSPAFRMSAGGGLTGLSEMPTHHHQNNMTLFGTERQIGEFGGASGAFRPVVSTEAGRLASKIRRKGAARFFCEICPADFTAKHNLRNHMKSHESIKDFLCDMCGRGFGTKHVLERHKPKCNSRPSAPRRPFKDAA